MFNERLKEARVNSGLTQEQAAKKLGIGKSTLAGYEVGRREPNMSTVAEMLKLFSVDANFLWQDYEIQAVDKSVSPTEYDNIKKRRNLDKHGKKIVDTLLKMEHERCTEIPHIKEQVTKYIPKFSTPMSAGSGEWDSGSDSEMVEVPLNDTTARATLIAPVSGDSMLPVYGNSDKVFIQSMPEIDEGEIGAWVVNGELFIKKLGKEELISVNPKFENIPLNENDDIRCIGKVIGKV